VTGTRSTTRCSPTARRCFAADRKRLHQTTAIGLDETSFVQDEAASHAAYATTVADVENHQIIDILPTRAYVDVAGWIDKQPRAWKERIRYGALDMSATYAGGLFGDLCPEPPRWSTPSTSSPWPTAASMPFDGGSSPNRPATGDEETIRSFRVRRVLLTGEEKLDAKATERLWSLLELGDPNAEVAIAYRVKERLRTSTARATPTRPARCSTSSNATA